MDSETNKSPNLRRNFYCSWPAFFQKMILTRLPLIFILAISTMVSTSSLFGQAANIDQIRNSNTFPGNTIPLWVNGNAGSSNSHYMEGQSIPYRVLLTGLVAGNSYSIVLGYDTKHSDHMAIDYLTHYQRLEPHGPFGHDAEVIDPLHFQSGSNQYTMAVVTGPFTATFPEPDPVPSGYYDNSDNGSHGGVDDGTPVDDQPKNSFNALPAGEKVMTIWNGTFVTMNYTVQESLTGASASAETQIRIKFTADDDSVLFAWGGHIASRLDWGFDENGIPLSASGISGSPYHMRVKQFFVYNGSPLGNKTCNSDSCEVGLGNQDRSLSAQAVIPPPECNVSGPTEACPETTSLQYSTTVTGVTYLWELINNTANAIISGSNTGQSITVTPNPNATTADFTAGGSFNVKLTTTANGITTVCYLGSSTAPGTNVNIVDVQVDATDADNAYTLNLNSSVSQVVGIQSISPGTTANYTFLWKVVSVPSGGNASLTNANSPAAGDITFNVLTPFAQGVYTIRVIATQSSAPGCKDSSTVTIDVTGGVTCRVNGPASVCPGSQDNIYFYDPNNDQAADPIPAGFTASWTFEGTHPSASFDGSTTGNTVKVDVAALGSSCNTQYQVRLTLTAVPPGVTSASCLGPLVTVADTDPPVITQCPTDKNLSCGASTLPSSTGTPTFTENCTATATFSDVTAANCNRTVITRTWTVTDICNNTATCIQTIILTDGTAPTITCPPNKTGASALICGTSPLPVNAGTATATDNCSAPADIIIYYKDAPAINVPCGTILRTWYAVDKAGNQNSCVQTIEFVAPPVTQIHEERPLTTGTVNPVTTSENNVAAKQALPIPAIGPGLQVQAYPNPFKKLVNFRFSSSESGRALLEVYNITGQKLGVVFEGYIKAGVAQDITYRAKWVSNSTLVYRFTVNGKMANGKLFQE